MANYFLLLLILFEYRFQSLNKINLRLYVNETNTYYNSLILFCKQMSYSTPMKVEHDEQPETGLKQPEYSDSQRPVQSPQDRLAQAQQELKQAKARIAQIDVEKKGLHEESEQYLNLDDEVRVIKKEIIDLEYYRDIAINQLKRDKKYQGQTDRNEKEGRGERKIVESGKQNYYSSPILKYRDLIYQRELDYARSRRLRLEEEILARSRYSRYYSPLYYDPLYYSSYRSYYPLYLDRFSYLSDPLYIGRYSYLTDPFYY